MTAPQPAATRLPGAVTKRLMFFAGESHPELAAHIAGWLGVPITPQTAHTFANGEVFVRFDESVRGCDAFVLQTPTAPLNTWLFQQLIMIDALKRASAKRITVIWPFYPYGRQDKKHRGREPISARLIADLLSTAGADRIITIDLHTPQTQGFFDGPVDHLLAQPLLADQILRRHSDDDIVVVAPDSGRVRLAERWAELLGGRPIAFIQHRNSLQSEQPDTAQLVGDVTARLCLVVDDMIDTGTTVVGATRLLHAAGAAAVIAAATHGVLSGAAPARLSSSRIREVIVTDTLPIPRYKHFAQLSVHSIAPLLGRAVREVFTGGSVTSLFNDRA